tara:strand:- start:5620 stop:6576 length:957 start_codon:yes stop_codon:yes gene_type:complete
VKWLSQHIVNLIARFRGSVYFENVENGTSDTDKFLVIGSAGKLKYRTGSEVLSDIGAGNGDITGVNITTDSGSGSSARAVSGSANFDLLGASGVNVTNSGTTITAEAVPGEIDHNSLNNYDEAKHFTQSSITNVGTLTEGTWEAGVISSEFLDADTAHYSATRQLTHHMFKDDIGTGVIYLPLGEIDSETGTISSKNLPLIAPVAGKLLKIFLRTSHDMSSSGSYNGGAGVDLTFSLLTRTTSQTTTGAASVVGAKTGAGPTNKTMVTYDFTTSLDSGVGSETNVINVGDKVILSIQSSHATAEISYFFTCLWEWNLS